MRHVVRPRPLSGLLALAACAATPKPFEHDSSGDVAFRPKQDKTEVTIATPANMPTAMAERVAAALAVELQSYGVVAAVQPATAPIQVNGAMSTRDAEQGIEIQIDWRIDGGAAASEDPPSARRGRRPEDYAEASERLVSRIAQQAAPRVATLMGRPPTFQPRSPGQVAAGVSVRSPSPDPAAATMAGRPVPAWRTAGTAPPRSRRSRSWWRRSPARRPTATASSSPACGARWARARSW